MIDCPEIDALRDPDSAVMAHLDRCDSCHATHSMMLAHEEGAGELADCARAEPLLALRALGPLGPAQSRWLARHLDRCSSCHAVAELDRDDPAHSERPPNEAEPNQPITGEFSGTERFRIVRRLGTGGMGVVYEAFDRDNDARVALKTLRRFDGRALYRFKQEFRALQGIEHPHLIRLGELIEDAGHWFFTMELVDGVNFLSYVRSRGDTVPVSPSEDTLQAQRYLDAARGTPTPFDETRLRAALGQLALGLHALHTAGKIHRDIKPSNALVSTEGRLVLLDFGLVTTVDRDAASTGASIVGTAEYMSPEQAIAGQLSPASDWYSTGVVLYEAMTGRLPHEGRGSLDILMKKQQYTPAPPRTHVASLPADLDELCVALLQRDPSKRPSGAEVLERIGVAPRTGDPHRSTSSTRFTQSVPFVGRDDELAALDQAFADCQRDGRALGVLVIGESGIGKTELARCFAERLAESDPGVVVLSSRCYERESVPYKAFDGIADALSAHMSHLPDAEVAGLVPVRADLLAEMFPVLRRVAAIANAPRGAHQLIDARDRRSATIGALRELLTRLAQRRRVVLIIDDFQWAGSDSFSMLQELFDHADVPPVLIVATIRTEAADVIEATHEAARIGIRNLRVERLPDDRTTQLVESLAPQLGNQRPELVRAIVAEASGHPLFVQELVRHAEQDGSDAASAGLDEALWSRIERLPLTARALIELLAVAEEPVAQEVAFAALSVDGDEFERAVLVLRVAFFARTTGARKSSSIETYHDRIREAVLSRIDPSSRIDCHRRLARALEDDGGEASYALVRHLEAAGERDRAAERAVDAAAQAARVSAFDQATDMLRTALRIGSFDATRQQELKLRLAEALANAGRGDEAATHYLELAELGDDVAALGHLASAVKLMLKAGDFELGIATMEKSLSRAGVSFPRTHRRAFWSIVWRRAWLRLRGYRWKEKPASHIPPAQLAKLDVLAAVGLGLGQQDTVRAFDFFGRWLLLALRLGEPQRIVHAMTLEAAMAATLKYKGITKARVLLDECRRAAGDDAFLRAYVDGIEGIIRYYEGRCGAAVEQLRRTEREIPAVAPEASYELGAIRSFQIFTLRMQGAYRELCQRYDEYLETARHDQYLVSAVRSAGNTVWLARDRPDDAERERRVAWPEDRGYLLPHAYMLTTRVEQHLYTGTVSSVLDELLQGYNAFRRSFVGKAVFMQRTELAWVMARLWLAVAEQSEAPAAALRKASAFARQLRKPRVCYAQVWQRNSLAAIAAQRGQLERAASLLRESMELADANDLVAMSGATRWRLGELVGGHEGDELRAEGESKLRNEDVVNPERMVAMLAPGFRLR